MKVELNQIVMNQDEWADRNIGTENYSKISN